MTYASRQFGRHAEQLAVRYLQRRDYHIIATNQRVGRGEIDIIARQGRVLAFIEVKARRSRSCGAPEDAVTIRKRLQIMRLAEMWLGSHPRALVGIDDVRYDVIAVDALTVPAHVRHLRGAF